MVRRMRDKAFRDEQLAGIRAEHIAPVNELVDRLNDPAAGRWAPYVAPVYGGTSARLLSVLRDPGPKTQAGNAGSGLLSIENDDATAERIAGLFADAGIDVGEVVPWNIYPWYINRRPTTEQLDQAAGPLLGLLALLPDLAVVMLHGKDAQRGWARLIRRHPDALPAGVLVIPTYHTSRQAFWHPDPAERLRRADHLADSFEQAAARLAVA
jgi:hypothetical protein